MDGGRSARWNWRLLEAMPDATWITCLENPPAMSMSKAATASTWVYLWKRLSLLLGDDLPCLAERRTGRMVVG